MCTSIVVGFGLGTGVRAEEVRTRLLATPLDTELRVELSSGESRNGILTDITEFGPQLLTEPDEEMRKQLRLPAGAKVKRIVRFEDIVALQGATKADVVEKYLFLQSDEPEHMQVLLELAAVEGFRLLAGAGRRLVILEKVETGSAVEYAILPDVREDREVELDDWGGQGFRLAPRTIGAWFGEPSAVMERMPGLPCSRDYRVLETRLEDTLQGEFLDAVRQGFRVVGLTVSGQHIALLESSSPCEGSESAPPEYLLLQDFGTADLRRTAARAFTLLMCSDGERLCVFEKSADSGEVHDYEFVAAAKLATFERELTNAGRRGFRVHPRALGVQAAVVREVFAVMERTEANPNPGFEYRIVSATGASEIQKRVASAARDGYRVVAMTSETKVSDTSPYRLTQFVPYGVPLGNVPFAKTSDVFVVLERPTP